MHTPVVCLPLCNIFNVAEVVVSKNYQGNKTYHLISSISLSPERQTEAETEDTWSDESIYG